MKNLFRSLLNVMGSIGGDYSSLYQTPYVKPTRRDLTPYEYKEFVKEHSPKHIKATRRQNLLEKRLKAKGLLNKKSYYKPLKRKATYTTQLAQRFRKINLANYHPIPTFKSLAQEENNLLRKEVA